jgi:hypothetical protein
MLQQNNKGDSVNKTSALRIRIDPNLHHQFLEICKNQERPASQVIKLLAMWQERWMVKKQMSKPRREVVK